MTMFEGFVTTLAEHHTACRDPRTIATQAIRLWPVTETIEEVLVSCVIDEALVTSDFVTIDTKKGHLYIDQSYSGLINIKPVRFAIKGDRYQLESTPMSLSGRYVVIGGPGDLVWYHWLFNWCPRMLLVKLLHPNLFDSEDVRFVVHPHAMIEPYRSILDSFELDDRRFLIIDPECDYLLEEAHVVSFFDQNKLYPTIITAFRRHLLEWFQIDLNERAAGVFASRQNLPAPKRRIANFHEIEPVLGEFGLKIVSLGARSAAEQAAIFHQARTVVGAHGSDLTNLLFCRPGVAVIVIESEFSVKHRLHVGLQKLAEILNLQYHLVLSATVDDGDHLLTAQRISRDYLVDSSTLRATLHRAISNQTAS